MARPTEYRQEFCEQVIEFMSQGKTLTAFAAELDVDRTTLYNWCEQHAEFLNAYKRAKAKSQQWWENRLQEMTLGEKGNITGAIFMLKARFGYRDMDAKEPAGSIDVPEESFDTEFGETRSKYESTR